MGADDRNPGPWRKARRALSDAGFGKPLQRLLLSALRDTMIFMV
jgi:hypothetical protein